MQKMGLFLNKNGNKILWLSIILYVVVFALICLFKYSQFGYNGLDLAIYNQVFFNSVYGRLFGFTIHPQSYLGDHFEIFIIALLPFYYLWQSPISLLILQTIILALCAWPIFLIAKKLLNNNWALWVALLWLLNPFTQNINLFEFHLLPFALIFLFFAIYFYLENKFWPFIAFIALPLLVREDVALIVAMFGILALIEKRNLKWIIWPIILGAGWFYLAIKVIAHFTPAGTYKFQYYYDWLGSTVPQMAFNFFFKPLNTLQHIFSINNVLFTLLMFMPFGFLNLLKPKYLLLCLPAFLQIILGGSGNSAVVLKLHYTSLFLPGFFLALIFSLRVIQQTLNPQAFLNKYKPLLIIILFTGTIYSLFTLGPLPTAAQKIFIKKNQELIGLKQDLVNKLNPRDAVVAGYDFLTLVSGRPEVYALNYAFSGKKQLSNLDYEIPSTANAILADTEDFLTYNVQFPNDRDLQPYYKNGDNNIRKLIKQNQLYAHGLVDSLAYFNNDRSGSLELYRLVNPEENPQLNRQTVFSNGLEFLGWDYQGWDYSTKPESNILPVSLYFKTNKKLEDDFQLKLIFKNKDGQIIYQKIYALAYGLYPTTEWQPNQVIKINYNFLIPDAVAKIDWQPFIELESIKGFLTLDGWGSAIIELTQENKLTPQIPLF